MKDRLLFVCAGAALTACLAGTELGTQARALQQSAFARFVPRAHRERINCALYSRRTLSSSVDIPLALSFTSDHTAPAEVVKCSHATIGTVWDSTRRAVFSWQKVFCL